MLFSKNELVSISRDKSNATVKYVVTLKIWRLYTNLSCCCSTDGDKKLCTDDELLWLPGESLRGFRPEVLTVVVVELTVTVALVVLLELLTFDLALLIGIVLLVLSDRTNLFFSFISCFRWKKDKLQ